MEHEDCSTLLQMILNLLKNEGVLQPVDKNTPVVDFRHPKVLEADLNLSLDHSTKNIQELLDLCGEIIRNSVKTSHPHFYNQLTTGVDIFGLGGTWISSALNTNQHTFEVAPAFTIIENAVLNHVQKLFGTDFCDGIFSPGGSISNMYGIVLARYKKYPQIKERGLRELPKMILFTSEEAHYSISKGAHWLGFGLDNITFVKTDCYGRMIPDEFEMCVMKCLADHKVPLFLNATVGTTVYGAIDPLQQLATICQKYNIWMHVDACFGGTLILSNQHKPKLQGIEKSDSISWNPHKMLGAPLQCSIFICKHKDLLHRCNSVAASYLFQQDKFYDVSYDTGDNSVQCGRQVDAFKLWVMWKARGNKGFEHLINNALSCAKYFQDLVASRDGFRLVLTELDTACVCFWYIPKNMRDKHEDSSWWETLGNVAPKIKEKMVYNGSLMMGYSPNRSKGLVNFFRFVVTCQPSRTYTDMESIVAQIEKFGEAL